MMKMFFFNFSLIIILKFSKKYFYIFMPSLILMNIPILIFYNNYFNYYWMKINMIFGMDYISLSLMILTVWIMSLSLMSNNNFTQMKNNMNFLMIMILLSIILIFCFSSMNFMMFYILFEASLIPIMMIIMGWGYQIDRIQASMYMLFYTLFGSLPLLVMIMYMYMSMNTLMMNIMWMINNILINKLLIYLMISLAFMIKMPIYMTHMWLPKAHVEAPISGSMILAGIMLKLGSYGMYRSILIYPLMFVKFNIYLITFSIFGSLIASLICLNQTDLKVMVAYSSVVHMSFVLSSMLTYMKYGTMGSLMMMIAHGLCSSGMFFLVNCNYSRINSRNILINKGMIHTLPSLTLWWFLMYSSNFSAPPSLNLVSEIFMFNSLIQYNKYLMSMIMLVIFFSTCYSIFMYAFSQYGKLNYSLMNFKMINLQEFLISFLLWIPLNFLFLNLNFMF